MTLIEFDDVGFRYPDGGVGLEGCSLAIRRGTRNALIGANGSGKTTLFQHCNGLLRPQSGVVRYAGEPLDYRRAGLRELRSRVGLVFQNPDNQLFSASVVEDVSFGPVIGPVGPVRASTIPLFVHLALVLAAGIWLPPPMVAWFQHVARMLG